MDEKVFYLGRKIKKQFRATIHSLFLDYTHKRLKPRNIARVNRLIGRYSSIDSSFVQMTVKTYENNFGISLREVLNAEQ